MKKARRPYDDVLTECAWCGKKFSPEDEILIVTATVDKSSKGITREELKAMEGQPINILFYSPAKDFRACVLYSNDPNFRAGDDIAFYTCSKSCVRALQEAIKKSKRLVVSQRYDH